jgi:Phage Tail Collar Domain
MPQSFKGISLANGYGGLLHLNSPLTINKSIYNPVYDGIGNRSALSVSYAGGGISVDGLITATSGLSVTGGVNLNGITLSTSAKFGGVVLYPDNSTYDLYASKGLLTNKLSFKNTTSLYKIVFGELELNSFIIQSQNNSSEMLFMNNISQSASPSMWIDNDGPVYIKHLITERISTENTALTATSRVDLHRHYVPVGSLHMFPLSSGKSGYLPCDGKQYLGTDYPDLSVYLADQFNTLTDGVHFNVPDYRGMFMRVTDYNLPGESRSLIDPDAGRAMGSIQYDGIRSHTHQADTLAVVSTGQDFDMVGTGGTVKVKRTNSANLNSVAETRPINKTIMMFIKY